MSVISDGPFVSPERNSGVLGALLCDWRRLEGTFDARAALELAGALISPSAAEGRDLHLDFSHVVHVEDRGLAALAAMLTTAGLADQVFFHGLSRHHIRLLSYFGVDAERSAPRLLQ